MIESRNLSVACVAPALRVAAPVIIPREPKRPAAQTGRFPCWLQPSCHRAADWCRPLADSTSQLPGRADWRRAALVPVEGIEPPLLAEHDFESCNAMPNH